MQNDRIRSALLCCHTGGRNRGCEAIVRSTAELLQGAGVQTTALTFDLQGDLNVGLDKAVKLIEYPKKNQMIRAFSFLMRRVSGNDTWGSSFYQKEIRKHHAMYDIAFIVGGDTYCYTTPWISITANLEAKKRGLTTVLWACSIDERLDTDDVLKEDISRYDYVVARESYSYEILCRNYNGNGRIMQSCDAAFHLKPAHTDVPERFVPQNTVGINISPLMIDPDDLENSSVFQNCIELIRWICSNTDMHVCLIPHVYRVQPQENDYKILNSLFQRFKDNPKVSLVDEELSAGELKYIISQCRFFIGSRTHSVIAAYSTCVPAIGLSYSIKSRGLAHDIMGEENGYAISWQQLEKETDLTQLFVDKLLQHESELRNRLRRTMPEYKNRIINTLEEIISGNE